MKSEEWRGESGFRVDAGDCARQNAVRLCRTGGSATVAHAAAFFPVEENG